MTLIIEQLDAINSQYEKMSVEKLIPCNCQECKTNDTPYFYEYKDLKRRINKGRNEVECGRSYVMVNVSSLIDDVISYHTAFKEAREELRDSNLQINIEKASQVIIQKSGREVNILSDSKRNELNVKSSWANGSFYLFAFVVVIGGLGFLSGSIPLYTLTLIVIAGVLVVPIIGAFQLRQDERLLKNPFLS